VLRTLCVIALSVALTGDAFAFQIETPITAGSITANIESR